MILPWQRAGKCLTSILQRKRTQNSDLLDFHGVNTLTVVNCKLPMVNKLLNMAHQLLPTDGSHFSAVVTSEILEDAVSLCLVLNSM